jgi:NDP-sugar pyrophosphorylase family protein
MIPILVLAGGLATRLRPITSTIPKSLVPVNGKPFVIHQLELFEKKNIHRIHFCLGFLGEMVEEVITNSRFNDVMHITFSYDGKKQLGTGGAILNSINPLPDFFFVTYGDSYLDINYSAVYDYFLENKKNNETCLMAILKNEGMWDKSNVIYEDGKLLLYSKEEQSSRMKWIDYGLGILTDKIFASFEKEIIFDLSLLYTKLSVENNLIGYPVKERFYEVGSFTGISDFANYLKNKL